jgi:hypothetical protein
MQASSLYASQVSVPQKILCYFTWLCYTGVFSCREACRIPVTPHPSDVQEGLKYMFPERSLVTVWSAPNYCYRRGNVASILCFDSALEREVKYFTELDENSNMMAPRATVPYFL